MITKELKEQGLTCKGKGFNCPWCASQNECEDGPFKNNKSIIRNRRMEEFVGIFTTELDKFIKNKSKYEYSYLMQYDNSTFVLRVQGATRGNVKIDENNNICEINLYRDTCYDQDIGCFNIDDKEKIEKTLNKYIGKTLIVIS